MAARMERRLRISGILIVLGLLVEALSLIHIHPLAFLAFMFIGGALLIAGIGIYLYSIASASSPPGD
jgi:predicted membrane channel-forming protein YqfA (hemolysin III family)